jgi:hypothetical protein
MSFDYCRGMKPNASLVTACGGLRLWNTAAFGKVFDEVRELLFTRVVCEPAIGGVVFTFVWGVDLPRDKAMVHRATELG